MSFVQLLFSFRGRINRIQYWIGMGTLPAFVMALLAGAQYTLNKMVPPEVAHSNERSRGILGSAHTDWRGWFEDNGALILWGTAFVLVLLIGLAVQGKRWHYRGKSGWWVLVHALPGIGNTWALVECGFIEGTPGPNRFGPPPGSKPNPAEGGGAPG